MRFFGKQHRFLKIGLFVALLTMFCSPAWGWRQGYTTVDSITITPAGVTDNCGLYLYEIEIRVSNFNCAVYDPSFGTIPPSEIIIHLNEYYNNDDWLGQAPIFKETYSTTPQCIWPMDPSAPPVSMQKLLLVGAIPGTTLIVGAIPCTTYPLSATCLDATTVTTKVPECECDVSINVSPSEVSPQKAGSANTTSTIMVSATNPPPEGCTVNFKVEPVENSGGHSHSGNRSKGTVTPATLTIPAGSLEPVYALYSSSDVSGQEKIIIEVNGSKADEKMVEVKVPDLMSLDSLSWYNLAGSTSTHSSNHYGTNSTKVAAYNMASDYWNETLVRLGINDMSLEWGGLFDINGNWSSSPGHSLHRTGESVDIDRCADGVLVNQRRLNEIAIIYGGRRIVEEALRPPPCAGPADFKPIDFLNYIISLKHEAYNLGWIKNAGIEQSLDAKLDNAKKKIEQGNIEAAKNILGAFINEVEAQGCVTYEDCSSGKHLAPEAYALLKYNVQYLIEKIQ